MKNASEFRKRAQKCREMAGGMSDENRQQMLEIAETWERLAHSRQHGRQKTPADRPEREAA